MSKRNGTSGTKQKENPLDRYLGLTREQIEELMQVEMDALHITSEDDKNRGENDTASMISGRLKKLGIVCDNAMRIRYALASEAIGHAGCAHYWFLAIDDLRKCRAFRSFLVRHGDLDTAEQYFGSLTRSEYSRIGHHVLKSCGGDDRYRLADRAFCLAHDTKGLEAVLKEAMKREEFTYIQKRAHRPLSESEKIATVRSVMSQSWFSIRVQETFEYIRSEGLGSVIGHAYIARVLKAGHVTLCKAEQQASALNIVLTTSDVEAYLASLLEGMKKNHSVTVEEVLGSIDWLISHGAKRWEQKRRGILLELRAFLLGCSNLEILDKIANDAEKPLTADELLAFIFKLQKSARYSGGDRERYQKALPFVSTRIANLIGVPMPKKLRKVKTTIIVT